VDCIRRRRRESNGDKLPELLADDPFDKLFEDEMGQGGLRGGPRRGAPQRQSRRLSNRSGWSCWNGSRSKPWARKLGLTPNQVSQNKRA